jgi:hypothetical protein
LRRGNAKPQSFTVEQHQTALRRAEEFAGAVHDGAVKILAWSRPPAGQPFAIKTGQHGDKRVEFGDVAVEIFLSLFQPANVILFPALNDGLMNSEADQHRQQNAHNG